MILALSLLGVPSFAVAAPDLVINSPSVSPATLKTGETLTASCVVKNAGSSIAALSSLKYYLSKNTTYDSSDTYLAVDGVGSLSSGSTSSEQADVTIPVGTAPGTWYILFRADANSQVSESNESNNVASRQITVSAPDLVVESTAVTPSSVKPGGTLRASCSVRNQGNGTASTTSLKYHLSRDSAYDSSDPLLAVDLVGSLAENSALGEFADLVIPSDTAPGSWYILFRADANDQIQESNESNNVASRQITVLAPDLVVESTAATPSSVEPGGTLRASCSIRNQGNTTASTSSLKYHLSKNSTYDSSDLLLEVDLVGSLAENGALGEFADLVIPSDIVPGTWYILFRADANDQIEEIDESNNIAAKQITVLGPDLTVSSATLSRTTLQPGEAFHASCEVKNVGGARAALSSLKYYLSRDSSYDGADTLLDVDRIGGLDPAQTSPEEADLILATGTVPGTWYILFQADSNSEVSETNESNNLVSRQIIVTNGVVFNDLAADHWAYPAALYLYERGLLQPDTSGNIRPFDSVLRAELAKLAFLGAGIPPLADNYPTPFNDLQERNAETEWYYSYAKNLSYLEFGDGIAPFTRDRFNFYPADPITRAHTLKVLLETWNVPLENTGSVPYNDVSSSHDAFQYIDTAYVRGLIDPDQTSFRPNDSTLRAEAFVMLYNLMAVERIPEPVVEQDDFFTTGNYTPANLGVHRRLVHGNFTHFTKTSFSIPGIRLSMVFGHVYNSYLTELPDELFPLRPLGNGWSHSFNSYIRPIDDKLVVFWPNGVLHVYKLEGNNAVPVTKGIYDTLTRVSSTHYTVRQKNQIVFTYEKLAGSDAEFPFVLTRITDRNDNSLILSYQAGSQTGVRRLERVTDTVGRTLMFSYHAGSDLVRDVTDPLNRRISFDYDNYSNTAADLVSFSDAKQQVTRYSYNTATSERHLLRLVTLPRGNKITNVYEERKLRSTQYGTRSAVQLAYQRNYDQPGSSDYVVTNLTAAGRSFEVSRSQDDTVRRMTGPESFLATYEHGDTRHPTLPTRIVGADGVRLDLTYDARGNALRIDRPLGVTERFVYTTQNDLLQYTDPRGKVTRFEYDARGNLVGALDPLDRQTTFTRDSRGLLTSVINPAGTKLTFTYDASGNLIGNSGPLGISTSATYNVVGRVLTRTDPLGFNRRYSHDANDNLISATDLFTTTFGYDGNDNRTSVTNAKGGVTTWAYNPEDLLESIEFAGARTSYSYFEDGRLSQRTDPDGVSTRYEYDGLERLTSDSNGNRYSYDSRGNLEEATNFLGTVQFTYDALNRVASTTDMFGNTVSYQYDLVGNVTLLTYPGSKSVEYAYYDDSSLRSVKDWTGGVTEYFYREDGQLEKTTHPNGVITDYSYDSAGRLTGIETRGSAGVLAAETLSRDAVGNILETTSVGSLPPDPTRLRSIQMSYDGGNRLREVGGDQVVFDVNGNISRKGSQTYRFDRNGRLLEVSGTNSHRFAYDALGYRRSVEDAKGTRRHVLDILPVAERILMETDGGVPVYYVYGLGLVSKIDASNEARYFHYDHLGSTSAITDRSQKVTHRYAYGPYGGLTALVEEDFNPFRFVGRFGVMYESDDLQFMRARYYDPSIARFLSEDPVWSRNLYAYAYDNPIRWADPTGRYIELLDSLNTLVSAAVEEYGKRKILPFIERAGKIGGRAAGVMLSSLAIAEAAGQGGLQGGIGQGIEEGVSVLGAGAGAAACASGGWITVALCTIIGDQFAGATVGVLRKPHDGVIIINRINQNDPAVQSLRDRAIQNLHEKAIGVDIPQRWTAPPPTFFEVMPPW